MSDTSEEDTTVESRGQAVPPAGSSSLRVNDMPWVTSFTASTGDKIDTLGVVVDDSVADQIAQEALAAGVRLEEVIE
jgi:hypothetical protein